MAVVFIDCRFDYCNFSDSKINHTAFRTAKFLGCNIQNVNFAMVDKFIFEIDFQDCILDFSKFYALKMKGLSFRKCSLVAVDFMETDLTRVVFENCDLYRAEFSKANCSNSDFKTSRNYSIDPSKTKVKKAIFSKSEVKGLLFKHDLVIV